MAHEQVQSRRLLSGSRVNLVVVSNDSIIALYGEMAHALLNTLKSEALYIYIKRIW